MTIYLSFFCFFMYVSSSVVAQDKGRTKAEIMLGKKPEVLEDVAPKTDKTAKTKESTKNDNHPINKTTLDSLKKNSPLIFLRKEEALCSIFKDVGVFELFLGNRQFKNARIFINGISVLKDAKYTQKRKNGVWATRKIEELIVNTRIRFVDNEWLGISISLTNTSEEAKLIKDIRFIDCEYSNALFGTEKINKMRLFSHSSPELNGNPGWVNIGETSHTVNTLGALYIPELKNVWFMAWQLPHRWPYTISIDGKSKRFSTSVNLQDNFTIRPGATVSFDEFVINGSLPFEASLKEYGELFKARYPKSLPKIQHGYLFSGDGDEKIVAEKSLKRLKLLSEWKNGASYISYYILKEGWNNDIGDWSFNAGFSSINPNWSKSVKKAKAIPGISISPFKISKTLNKTAKLPVLEIKKIENSKYSICDPSTEVFIKNSCRQFYRLVNLGIKLFRVRGITSDISLEDKHISLKDNSFTMESALIYTYSAIRKITGNNTLLLSDEKAIYSTAGNIDILQAGLTAPSDWIEIREKIVRKNAFRFWMHDTIYLIAQAPLNFGSKSSPTKVRLTLDELRSWCSYLVITGGPIFIENNVEDLSSEKQKLMLITLKHSGGNAGSPIDILKNNLPEKWIRRESDKVYIALINWSDKTKEILLDYNQVRELALKTKLTDIFTNKPQQINTGVLKINLKPHQSFCTIIK